jgi:hypothetical protein
VGLVGLRAPLQTTEPCAMGTMPGFMPMEMDDESEAEGDVVGAD